MAKQFAAFEGIESKERITEEIQYEFIYRLESAMLLALHEQGQLNAVQYRQAEEKLKQQRIKRLKSIIGRGDSR